jgi:hypothetical protein
MIYHTNSEHTNSEHTNPYTTEEVQILVYIIRFYPLKSNSQTCSNEGLELSHLTPLSAIFQLYIVAVTFIGGGNRSTC